MIEMSLIKVYHGSSIDVSSPSLSFGRTNADFGVGFYVTTDLQMAEKWASRKKKSIINEYVLNTDNLKVYSFDLNKEWLDYVVANREEKQIEKKYQNFDVLCGATADDRLFPTIEQYEQGFLNEKWTIRILNCMKVGEQICLKTQKALEQLQFVESVELSKERVQELKEINQKERIMSQTLTSEMLRQANGKSKGMSL